MSSNTTVKLSIVDAVLYRGTPGGSLPAATLVSTVENVSLKVSKEKAKAFNRLSTIKQYLAVHKDVTVEIAFPADSADTHLAAFRYAMLHDQPIPVLLGNGSEAASTRWSGLMGVESGDDDEELEGVPMQKFSLFPWAVGASGTQPGFNA